VLAQEMLRGGVNATLAGAVRGVPVVTYMGISPIEYFRCRRERRQIGAAAAAAGRGGHPDDDDDQRPPGDDVAGDGSLSRLRRGAVQPPRGDRPLLRCRRRSLSARHRCGRARTLRERLDLPRDAFPDRALEPHQPREGSRDRLQAVAFARARGLNAVLLNLGGGYREFQALAAGWACPMRPSGCSGGRRHTR
jgi:hypothetical protein